MFNWSEYERGYREGQQALVFIAPDFEDEEYALGYVDGFHDRQTTRRAIHSLGRAVNGLMNDIWQTVRQWL